MIITCHIYHFCLTRGLLQAVDVCQIHNVGDKAKVRCQTDPACNTQLGSIVSVLAPSPVPTRAADNEGQTVVIIRPQRSGDAQDFVQVHPEVVLLITAAGHSQALRISEPGLPGCRGHILYKIPYLAVPRVWINPCHARETKHWEVIISGTCSQVPAEWPYIQIEHHFSFYFPFKHYQPVGNRVFRCDNE